MPAAESFSLTLSTSASVEDLEAWMAAALAGHVVVYAIGIDLPRTAPGVLLVKRWADAGHVVLLPNMRDEADRRRWLFRCARTARAAPVVNAASESCCAEHPETTRQKDALLAHLRMVVGGAGSGLCPSNRAIARALGLGEDQRGRRRADYLLQLLVDAGAIELTNNGTNRPRGLRVLSHGDLA